MAGDRLHPPKPPRPRPAPLPAAETTRNSVRPGSSEQKGQRTRLAALCRSPDRQLWRYRSLLVGRACRSPRLLCYQFRCAILNYITPAMLVNLYYRMCTGRMWNLQAGVKSIKWSGSSRAIHGYAGSKPILCDNVQQTPLISAPPSSVTLGAALSYSGENAHSSGMRWNSR